MRPGNTQHVILAVLFTAAVGVSMAHAEEHVRGVITQRGNDGALMVRADDSSHVTVVLDDATKVKRTDGLREMKVSSAALIPGLRIRVEGVYVSPTRFAAEIVSFSRADLKMALAIKAGVDPTDRRTLDNQQRIQENVKTLERQQQMLQRQETEITANKERIRSNDEQLLRTNAAVDATNTRIANLDDHKIVSETTVYFRNGSAAISKQHKAELKRLAAQAKGLHTYVIQVQGHASAVGRDALNQTLSMQRAQAVAALLSQNGIPPTHMLVPATMGASEQVASNKTMKGQGENRRAVVTLLQNEGLTDGNPATRGKTTVERVDAPKR